MSISSLRRFDPSVSEHKKRIAVVLFNLGGPDSLEAVRPFLYNLFSDPAILSLPYPFRKILAWLISRFRETKAQKVYEKLGGQSPIFTNTIYQKLALEEQLKKERPQDTFQVFIAMRYWHPRLSDILENIREYSPDHIVLLPLYPQYSTTTTASSFREWDDETAKQKIKAKVHKIYSYPDNPSFIESHVCLIELALDQTYSKPRLLFSAHGLPQKIVDAGDPYEKQVNQTVEAIIEKLRERKEGLELDFSVCYQSKVGPLKWLGPSIQEALQKAGSEKKPVIVVPVAFVSEHCETLVELDMDYSEFAQKVGVPSYYRVPTLGTHPAFIRALTGLALSALDVESKI